LPRLKTSGSSPRKRCFLIFRESEKLLRPAKRRRSLHPRRMIVNRRQALRLVCINGVELLLVGGCAQPLPTTPSEPVVTFSSLLERVRSAGFISAQRVAFGSDGAARIAIQGGINWNFFVNDQPVAIGPVTAPTIDVSAIPVSNDARLIVRGL